MTRRRSDKKGSRRGEWGDEGVGDFPEPSFFSHRLESARSVAAQPDPVEADVLWFNAPKGFGFVQPLGGDKAFLHVKQLEAAGISDIAEGARLRVVIEPGPKGLSVTRVMEILSTPAAPAGQERNRSFASHNGTEGEASGTVKWYNAEKGFGFIGRSDGGPDIFVHATALSRSGITTLEEGQAVTVRYVEGKKGPEARALDLT
ncbi:cold-shock protein [Chelativorans sp.]|uniref:cold-shock protein n=1 Tax=Chelativorans sp. TaxID=2203393 RepID=UPI002811D7A1|nr:cold-shock protein [Chelativorans sp.]